MPGKTTHKLGVGTVGGKIEGKGCAGMKGGAPYSLIGGLDGNNGSLGNSNPHYPHEVIGKHHAGVVKVEQPDGNPSNMSAASIREPGSLNQFESKIMGEPQLGGSGGAAYGFNPELIDNMDDFGGGYAPITSVKNNLCNMNGGKFKGKKIHICHDINKVKTYGQVKDFWGAICPGAVMIYDNHLSKLANKQSTKKQVFSIVKLYTQVFCDEVKALESSIKKHAKECLISMRHNLERIEKKLEKIAPESITQHKMVSKRHLDTVKSHIEKLGKSKTLKHGKVTNKSKTLKHHVNHTLKSDKLKKSNKQKKQGKTLKHHLVGKNKTRKVMKGGYSQYLSGTPFTPTYGFDGSGTLPGGVLTAPYPITRAGLCTDNYNHYIGKGGKTGVFDGDVNQ